MKIMIQEKGKDKIQSYQSMKQFKSWFSGEFGSYIIKYKISRNSDQILSGDWLDCIDHLKQNGELIFKSGKCYMAWVR